MWPRQAGLATTRSQRPLRAFPCQGWHLSTAQQEVLKLGVQEGGRNRKKWTESRVRSKLGTLVPHACNPNYSVLHGSMSLDKCRMSHVHIRASHRSPTTLREQYQSKFQRMPFGPQMAFSFQEMLFSPPFGVGAMETLDG
jgi:hypothetical protein